MAGLTSTFGHELPLVLLLIALLGFRRRVTPRASLLIHAPIEKVFELVDFRAGDMQRWQRTKVRCELLDEAKHIYRLHFTTPLATGSVSSSKADFQVTRRLAPRVIDIKRIGIDHLPENNQLLTMSARLVPEGAGTRLTMVYEWGSRSLLAQLLARTDLWGSVYRLKGLAETGVPDYRTDAMISASVALLTGALTLMTFSYAFGHAVAVLVVGALFLHEMGHLLAYRMIGQPWGRILFLPFLGAIAVPRIGFVTQAQVVFSAIMGPAMSVLIPLLAAVYAAFEGPYTEGVALVGIVAAALNLFNLLPVEPLDGGVVLRSVLARLMGQKARFGLIAIGALLLAVGVYIHMPLISIFGGIAILANIRPRKIDGGLEPMSSLQMAISAFGFMATVAAYAMLLRYLITYVPMTA